MTRKATEVHPCLPQDNNQQWAPGSGWGCPGRRRWSRARRPGKPRAPGPPVGPPPPPQAQHRPDEGWSHWEWWTWCLSTQSGAFLSKTKRHRKRKVQSAGCGQNEEDGWGWFIRKGNSRTLPAEVNLVRENYFNANFATAWFKGNSTSSNWCCNRSAKPLKSLKHFFQSFSWCIISHALLFEAQHTFCPADDPLLSSGGYPPNSCPSSPTSTRQRRERKCGSLSRCVCLSPFRLL